jgi:hypothetical protein
VYGNSVARDHLADAVQEALIAVMRGGFKGGTERQATAWLTRVLLNALRKQLRDRRRRLDVEPRSTLEPAPQSFELKSELREMTRAAVALLRDEIRRTARPRDTHLLELDFELWLRASLGESTASQIGRAGALLVRRATSDAPGPWEAERASARVRQRRRRGRIAATRALERLRAAGSWPAELDPTFAILGLSPCK